MLKLGTLELDPPAVMGVLNVTPDSFSDGGRFAAVDDAVRCGEQMARGGAGIIDVGGESTRPGALPVSEQEEIDRVLPIIEGLRERVPVPLSIDSSKPGVMRAAVAAGAALVNDVFALRHDGALETAAELGVPVCLMHMQGSPRTMQREPHYADVVGEVVAFLEARARACLEAGIDAGCIVVDPGFGFGKTVAHNLALLKNLRQLRSLGFPILVGLSRKATLGAISGRDVGERLPASLAAAVLAVREGAQIVRAHDVAETVDALKIVRAVMETTVS